MLCVVNGRFAFRISHAPSHPMPCHAIQCHAHPVRCLLALPLCLSCQTVTVFRRFVFVAVCRIFFSSPSLYMQVVCFFSTFCCIFPFFLLFIFFLFLSLSRSLSVCRLGASPSHRLFRRPPRAAAAQPPLPPSFNFSLSSIRNFDTSFRFVCRRPDLLNSIPLHALFSHVRLVPRCRCRRQYRRTPGVCSNLGICRHPILGTPANRNQHRQPPQIPEPP